MNCGPIVAYTPGQIFYPNPTLNCTDKRNLLNECFTNFILSDGRQQKRYVGWPAKGGWFLNSFRAPIVSHCVIVLGSAAAAAVSWRHATGRRNYARLLLLQVFTGGGVGSGGVRTEFLLLLYYSYCIIIVDFKTIVTGVDDCKILITTGVLGKTKYTYYT